VVNLTDYDQSKFFLPLVWHYHPPLFAFKIDLGSRCPLQNYRG